jgi:hypothetical protein
MEIRISRQRVPTRPFVFVIAILSVFALALTTWYTLARSPQSVSHGPDRTYATPLFSYGPAGPDAQSRDLEQRIAQIKDDTTHGH